METITTDDCKEIFERLYQGHEAVLGQLEKAMTARREVREELMKLTLSYAESVSNLAKAQVELV